MTDPLDRLRDQPSGSHAPHPDVIKHRAGRIQARRRAIVGGSAAVTLAAVGLVAVLAGETPDTSTQLAERVRTPTAQPRATPEDAASEEMGAGHGSTEGLRDSAQARSPVAGTGGEPADTSSASGGAAARPAPAAESLELTLTATSSASKDEHRFVLRACNPTDRTVDVTFSSAQRYDFEVTRDGDVVWTWSATKSFAQIMGTETWAPGDCREWVELWRGERTRGGLADPGAYSAVGMLASSPERRSDPVEVCRISCL